MEKPKTLSLGGLGGRGLTGSDERKGGKKRQEKKKLGVKHSSWGPEKEKVMGRHL